MFVFTDGSRLQSTDPASGAGWVGYWGASRLEFTRGHRLIPHAEVFDAEATAALEGLQAALASVQAEYSKNLYILLDNQEAAQQLQGHPTGSSQATFHTFHDLARTWPAKSLSALGPGRVHVGWIPGHSGIKGNEEADKEAKQGATSPTPQAFPPAKLAWAQHALKEHLWQRFSTYWADTAPQQYKDLAIGLDKNPSELQLPRATLGRLLAARSGHGDFARYHERLGHTDTKLECSCGRAKSPHHFFYCRLGRKAAAHPWGQQTADYILSTKAGVGLFKEWIKNSNFYLEICTDH